MGETVGAGLDALTARIRAATPQAAFVAMEYLRGVAVEKTPRESGNLRDGAHVDKTATGATLTYEGPYARYQHYELQLNHHGVGQALYLEQPLVTETPEIIRILGTELGNVI